MTTVDRGTVLEDVAAMIAEVIGEDELLFEGPIALDTSFNEDLELESIEIVALAELVQTRYGDAVDFAGWISAMELDAIIALSVGDLVEFIVSCRASPSTD